MSDRTMLLDEMSWPEVARVLEEGWTTVVVAVGAVVLQHQKQELQSVAP